MEGRDQQQAEHVYPMLSADPGGSAAAPPKPKLEAEPGQRRLRRTMHYVAADGRPAVKCAGVQYNWNPMIISSD